ncbi:A/G-specific adenine glycosylase, partial [Paenibacillus pabuli]|nr:A/G-specific adenine glycosylase [Paenibacillus pabuli]
PAAAGKAAGPLADEPAMALLAGSLWAEGFAARPEGLATHAEHVFSHIVWGLQVYKCTEQDQIGELPLIAAEARAAYDAQAAAKDNSSSAPAALEEPAANLTEQLSPEALPLANSQDDPSLRTESPQVDHANTQLMLTGKGDGLTYCWIGPEDMDKMAFPNIFLKLISSYFAGSYDQLSE